MAVTPVGPLFDAHSTMAKLTSPKWQFKFFDVAEVKLPDGESSFLSEVFQLPTASQIQLLTSDRQGTSPP
jgi:hypothetical protein